MVVREIVALTLVRLPVPLTSRSLVLTICKGLRMRLEQIATVR